MIDDALISSYIYCNHKAYLHLNYPHEANETNFHKLEVQIKEDIYQRYAKQNSVNNIQRADIQLLKPASKHQVVLNPFFKTDEFFLNFYSLSQDKNLFIPYDITIFENPTKEEKLISCFKAFILKVQNKSKITEVSFIKNSSLKISKVKLTSFSKDYQKILQDLKGLIQDKLITKPSIKPHCQICQFQNYCKKQLIEKEDLSLLSGLRVKEVLKKQEKGIFSITQLAYTFSPKRKLYSKKKFLPELKALAVRDKKTYIIKPPEFKPKKIEIFLDIEGIPDSKSYYLIGVIVKEKDHIYSYTFWKDSNSNLIFQQFLDLIATFEDFNVYHYGTYEITALRAQSPIFQGTPYQIILEKLLLNCVNILDEFLVRVYPPTFTNSLKDVSAFLGFEWTEPDINGYKSIFWRKYWGITNDLVVKEKLIRYNLEDCQALLMVKNWLNSLTDGNKSNENVSQVADIKKQSLFKFGDTGYIVPEFKEINNYAYFNYQRDKIYLKTNKKIKKTSQKNLKVKSAIPNQKIYAIKPENCPSCGYHKLYKQRKNVFRKVFDLKFGENSVKKWIIFYEQERLMCVSCKKTFVKNPIQSIAKYGWNLKIWCINQTVSYNISTNNVVKSLDEQFGIKLANAKISNFKSFLADFYKNTTEKIKHMILTGGLLQVDESQVEVRDIKGKCYVWVFTTIDSVYYLFKEDREADFLKEMLKDFKGVLISDFYAGYDALECSQQKCLVHLMRDLNDDLIKNPFNTEYQLIVNDFAALLKNITDTINTYGLKKRNLNKHKKDVLKYFEKIFAQKFETEIALFYQKKFKKYRDKLFTFLDYDGVPWNNNNAEVAIKPFAIHRNNLNGVHTKKGIEEYLVLLSIQQTCKYRNLSFWEFLKSKKTEL